MTVRTGEEAFMENILITGGAGFIGSHLAERSLEKGYEVTVIDNFDPFYDPNVKRQNISKASMDPRYQLLEGDIRDEEFIHFVFGRHTPDIVVHLAARAGVRPSIDHPVIYNDVNVRGTAIILEACHKHGVKRFIFGSSSSVYGNAEKVPFSEDDNVDYPVSPYAATKKAGELLCYTYHHLYGMAIHCLRFFTVFGPRQRPEMAIHKFTRMIDRDEELTQYGNGKSSRDYTYIEDIIDGVMASIENVSGYEIINLGESKTTSITELIKKLEALLGKKARVRVLPHQPGDVHTTCADIRKAARILGYAPKFPVDAGLKVFVEWYKDTGQRTFR
ncbi:MAG: GDP-mannose 4,6-dehydratase [Acidobacteriota bacterium]